MSADTITLILKADASLAVLHQLVDCFNGSDLILDGLVYVQPHLQNSIGAHDAVVVDDTLEDRWLQARIPIDEILEDWLLSMGPKVSSMVMLAAGRDPLALYGPLVLSCDTILAHASGY